MLAANFFMLSPKILKSQIHISTGWGGGGDCWPTFDAESKNPKFIFLQEWRRRSVGSQLLMLSPKMLKSPKFTFSQVGEGGWQPSLDAESRNAKIPNSHFHRWDRGIESQLLMLSPKMLKSQIQIFTGGTGGLKANF